MPKIKRPADLGHLDDLLSFVLDFARKHKMKDDAVFDFRLALEEVLVNIISYAYPDGPGDIQLECSLAPSGDMSVKVSDRGIPFDPLKISAPDLDAPLDERREGGLGIFLASNLADDVRYSRENDKNMLVIVKRIETS